MANLTKRLSTNVEGNFFVDATCIDCDTCRQLAPETFMENGDYSTVFHQPTSPSEEQAAYQALLACPVGSIGVVEQNTGQIAQARASFPQEVEPGVLYNGFNSGKSFGANSYFLHHPDGNWLIDSPRYLKQLVTAFEAHGGIRYIFLSHEDDVAEAARYAKAFGAVRIIHRADAHAMPDAEWIVDGEEPVAATPDCVLIPVPGHTAGSMSLLYRQRFLFTGDHLWWDQEHQQLRTPSVLIWDKRQLLRSLSKLLPFPFEWVLPGHGHRVHLPATTIHRHLQDLIASRSS